MQGYDRSRNCRKLEFNGAWIKPLVHTHYRSLSLYSLNSTASTVIPMFGNILTSPSFPQDAFENIAGQAVERVRIDREKVSVLAGDELRGLAYGQDSPIARYATPESVAGISRCAIKDFYYRNLNSAGIHAFLAGKISEETAACVRDMLMAFPEGKNLKERLSASAPRLPSAAMLRKRVPCRAPSNGNPFNRENPPRLCGAADCRNCSRRIFREPAHGQHSRRERSYLRHKLFPVGLPRKILHQRVDPDRQRECGYRNS